MSNSRMPQAKDVLTGAVNGAHPTQQNGHIEYSIGATTPADLAVRYNLKRETANGKVEYHGPNPFDKAGAKDDGFILNDDGTAWDRSLDRRYTSPEVAALFGISRNQYEPCHAYQERNDHNNSHSNGYSNGHTSPMRATAPQPQKTRKTLDTRTLAERGITPETMQAFGITHDKNERDGAFVKYPTHHPNGERGRDRLKYQHPDRAGTPDKPIKNIWTKTGGEGIPCGYGLEHVQRGDDVFLVNGEVSVWSCHEKGIKAVCPLGEARNPEPYLKALQERGAASIRIVFDNDITGRTATENTLRAARAIGLTATAHTWPSGSKEGADVSDLYEQCQKDGREFLAALETLPIWTPEADAPNESSTRKEKQSAENKTEKEVKEFVFEYSTDADLDSRLTGIEWLWEGYIPRGFVTGLVADQDQGKSTVAQNFCDIVLRGTRWPDGQPHTPAPNTKLLWLDTEGSIALFHDRVKQWKMPRGRFILPPDPLQELTVDDFECWMWIEAAIEKFHPPLVVVDALSGAHRGKENGNDEMKLVMKKLAGLAQKHNIAVLVIHHLGKPTPGDPTFPISIHRLRGASAISQYCRSILAVGTPDTARPEARRLDVIKLNLARKPAPVGYELTDVGPAWGKAPEAPKQRRAIDDAMDFLEIALSNGMRPSDEVTEEAKANNIGSNALMDARKVMGIKAKHEGGKNGRWFWIPPQKTVKAFNEGEEQ